MSAFRRSVNNLMAISTDRYAAIGENIWKTVVYECLEINVHFYLYHNIFIPDSHVALIERVRKNDRKNQMDG